MNILNSLRFRITVAVAAFAAALTLVYSTATWMSVVEAEDRVFISRINNEIAEFKKAYESDPNTPLPGDRYLTAYPGIDALPDVLRDKVPPPGVVVELKSRNKYIAATEHAGDTLYLVTDVSKLEILDGLTRLIILSSLCAGIVAVAIALWLGGALASRVIAPVISLANIFRDRRSGNFPRNFAADYYNDEIGFLAETLEQQIARIEEFVEHEIRFSRDASHELRTPVTSIKLALNLISEAPETSSPALKKAIDRISRANTEMEHLIETLLWLSRERRKLERAGPVTGPQDDAIALLRQCIESHRALISDKPVEIELIDRTSDNKMVYRDLFSIAAGNLVRNAFQYTEEGKVTVTLTDESVTVLDTGRGLSGDKVEREAPTGYGFGLELVRRICYRCGWKFDVRDAQIQGTEASIFFATTEEASSIPAKNRSRAA